jgi:transcriptional regulator with XRE-family HTH domain
MTLLAETAMSFGTQLRRLREKAGLSQRGLAERAGVSLRSVQNWEQGHRAPRARPLLALARALGVSVEALLTEEPTPAKKPRRGKRS